MQHLHMSNLQLRIISAVVLAPIVIWAIIQNGWVFAVLIICTMVAMAVEWQQLTARAIAGLHDHIYLGASLGIIWLLAALQYPLLALMVVAIAVLIRLAIWRVQSSDVRVSLWPALGVLYIGLPIIALLAIAAHPSGVAMLGWLFALVWATDIGGYIFGRTFGGPKLAPSISPNKTWSGLGGAVLWAAIIGAIFGWVTESGWVGIALVSGVLAVVAQMGDLCESKIKRYFGKKDSGALIPGHGGILDRIDGLIFAAPALVLLQWLNSLYGWVAA